MSLRIVLAIAALVVGSEAYGQELTGTLKRIRDTNTVLIGHRDAAIPFSYLNAAGEPIGYSLDLCAAIVREIRNEVDRESIVIKYVPVASEDRIQAVIRGSIDLECGSTTNTRERRQEVSFSPVIFVTGTKMMVRRSVPFRTYDDLKGKRIAVSAGTTNEAAIRAFSASHKLGFDVQPSPDLAQAFERFRSGQADAFGTDEVLLFGFRARAPDSRDFKIVGEYLSYEPYGIMYRKDDPQFAAVVERSFSQLASSREILEIYHRWFIRTVPPGIRMQMSMSPQLRYIFDGLGMPGDSEPD